MTNDIFCVGLTRTELQTLGVLLPTTFQIISVSPEELNHAAVERIVDQARCIILNPKRLSVDLLDDFLRGQDDRRINDVPVPIILFSDTMTREQRREVFMPEYPILSVDLHERFDRNRNLAVKLLRESTLPCWQNREAMRSNMFNDAWYLIDIETTGLDRWKDRIIAIRIARMANYEINWERPTIYIRQAEPLPAPVAEITGITDKMLAGGVSMEEALEELDSLPCKDTPFLFTNEDFATGFLNAEYLRCGKTFGRPYRDMRRNFSSISKGIWLPKIRGRCASADSDAQLLSHSCISSGGAGADRCRPIRAVLCPHGTGVAAGNGLAKDRDTCRAYLSHHHLDAWVFRKFIQKACESYRVSAEDKAYLRSLRKK